ncbi:creatininase family protein [Aquabacterium humicola]|uniref:creatininase family protein n=1 Tax=Aquabacterium humicola TaxID=3237377 RepID=UPI002542D3E0|nr:creatininase family protein [Rubrivivax pictus]
MRIRDMNWMQVEALLKTGEDRVVLPLGSIEQHAWLSLAVDALLAEAVAVDAAEPLGVPVFAAQPYGYTPTYMAFPGTVTLKLATLLAVLGDIVESLHHHGFRRVLVVNGHGGNSAGASLAQELMARLPGLKLRWHNWWSAPKTWAFVQAQDREASHASWMENFASTRLAGVVPPTAPKPLVDYARMALMDPVDKRAYLGDGCYGGRYEVPAEVSDQLWRIAVDETRAALRDW